MMRIFFCYGITNLLRDSFFFRLRYNQCELREFFFTSTNRAVQRGNTARVRIGSPISNSPVGVLYSAL